MKTVEQAQAFLAEVREVCQKHGFQIEPSEDGLVVLWELGADDPEFCEGVSFMRATRSDWGVLSFVDFEP
jgi:hypothetical protein